MSYKPIFAGLYLGAPEVIYKTPTPSERRLLEALRDMPVTYRCQIPKVSGNDIAAAVAYVNAHADAGEYTLLIDEDIITHDLHLNQENARLTIMGIDEMRKISMDTSSQGRIFTVGASEKAGISLTLGDNITLVGHEKNHKQSIVCVQNYAYLTMNGNSIIEENSGGGVYVDGNGTFTMNDNTSVYCYATASSRDVEVKDKGRFTMKGYSSVSGNEVRKGGGVYVGDNGTFTMNDNASVSNNGKSWGGGVCVGGNGTFIMNGDASVYRNTACYGGGVHVTKNGIFTMNDYSSVSENTARENTSAYGGGVYVNDNGTFTMNGNASVTGNTVTGDNFGDDGGVFCDYYCNAYGGGVCVRDKGIFTMNDNASITGNRANGYGNYGSGVCAKDEGTFRISGGILYGNNEGKLSNKSKDKDSNSPCVYGVAEYGMFSGKKWTKSGSISTTDKTIKVVNGVLQ